MHTGQRLVTFDDLISNHLNAAGFCLPNSGCCRIVLNITGYPVQLYYDAHLHAWVSNTKIIRHNDTKWATDSIIKEPRDYVTLVFSVVEPRSA
jgi:hypothetical protein